MQKKFSVIKSQKLLLMIFFIIFLQSCIPQKNYLRKFPPITFSNCFKNIQDDVLLFVKMLNQNESKNQFGVNLISKGYVPLQIKIENRSSNTYLIRPSYIGLDIVDPGIIAKLLHWDTYFWMLTAGGLSLMFWWPATIWLSQAGYDMYKSNRVTNELINECSIHDDQSIEILPYEIFNKFIFVERDNFSSEFIFKMFNQTERKILIFDINL